MNLEDINPQQRVVYVPTHEFGTVSSKNDAYVFVKFDKNVAHLGWDGTTSQGCNPEDLREA